MQATHIKQSKPTRWTRGSQNLTVTLFRPGIGQPSAHYLFTMPEKRYETQHQQMRELILRSSAYV